MSKKIDLSKFKDDLYDGISDECINHILNTVSLQVAKEDAKNFIILETTPSWMGKYHVEIRLDYLHDIKLYVIRYVELDNVIIDDDMTIYNSLQYLEDVINNMYKSLNEETSKKKLPCKGDFKLDDDYILDEIGEKYIKEHERWLKDKIKEHYINISTNINFSLLTDNQKISIVNMFTNLGFKKDEIELCEYNDTHKLYIRLKIY